MPDDTTNPHGYPEAPTGAVHADVRFDRSDVSTGGLILLDLPGDGLYGLSLAVGDGAAATPPAPGELPDWWVEVKTNKPVAQITGVHPENGVMIITWTATDACLKAEPIDLYYAARPDGPWLPIAQGLRNDGSYRWTMAGNMGNEIYVRMEVTDRAGNVTECQTPRPR